ncbi:hypothetical protein SBF1_3820004 [Candidatus Desulfosporosinus infrequens]|uniref:Uncharacterized protein n=1 Tax=Candidatus Desulfosporosinus infrequens TaxID=2043169 RepID=A0A2U3L5T2_9FIRM|nr:hypothetical protein SBF1_3820004 [Candidatus Desulfosporosinus infrequens]
MPIRYSRQLAMWRIVPNQAPIPTHRCVEPSARQPLTSPFLVSVQGCLALSLGVDFSTVDFAKNSLISFIATPLKKIIIGICDTITISLIFTYHHLRKRLKYQLPVIAITKSIPNYVSGSHY